MVRKFSFRSNFYVDVSQTFTFNTFYRFENSFYFMKHIPEVKIFYSGTFIFHKKFLTMCVAVNFLDETIFSTSIYH